MERPTQVKLHTQDIANVLLIHIAGRVDSLDRKAFRRPPFTSVERLHWRNQESATGFKWGKLYD